MVTLQKYTNVKNNGCLEIWQAWISAKIKNAKKVMPLSALASSIEIWHSKLVGVCEHGCVIYSTH